MNTNIPELRVRKAVARAMSKRQQKAFNKKLEHDTDITCDENLKDFWFLDENDDLVDQTNIKQVSWNYFGIDVGQSELRYFLTNGFRPCHYLMKAKMYAEKAITGQATYHGHLKNVERDTHVFSHLFTKRWGIDPFTGHLDPESVTEGVQEMYTRDMIPCTNMFPYCKRVMTAVDSEIPEESLAFDQGVIEDQRSNSVGLIIFNEVCTQRELSGMQYKFGSNDVEQFNIESEKKSRVILYFIKELNGHRKDFEWCHFMNISGQFEKEESRLEFKDLVLDEEDQDEPMCPKKNWDIYFSSDSESDSQERKFMGYVEEPPISGDWVDDEHKKDFFD